MSKLKHFKEFETYSEYETYINGSPVLPNVSFVGHDVYYKDGVPTPPTPPIPSIISAGMICYADSSNNLKFCSKDEWDSSLGTAQGVVVVPSNHTSDGTARIMCITGVNTDGTTASTESIEQLMVWGPIRVDTGLPNMYKVPTWDNTIGGAIGNNDIGYLPSDSSGFTGATCACDSLTKYPGSTPYIPSPYLEDGSQNPDYINTVEVPNNSLSDFNGKYNTSVLVGLGTAYTAANACNQYGTTALPAGSWYLPAMGELGYIMPRFNDIQSALQTVGGVQVNRNNDGNFVYFSSTEYNEYGVWHVRISGGTVQGTNKNTNRYVRAFASVPIE